MDSSKWLTHSVPPPPPLNSSYQNYVGRNWASVKRNIKGAVVTVRRLFCPSSALHSGHTMCVPTERSGWMDWRRCDPWRPLLACYRPSEAQWLLYVPPGLTLSNSTFCPHSVFMCFVWISEQTAIISLYSINWLVCITGAECVYCAVRTESLKRIRVVLFFTGLRSCTDPVSKVYLLLVCLKFSCLFKGPYGTVSAGSR
jgi:hypothetical protein